MYLSLLSWAANDDGAVESTDAAAQTLIPECSPFFLGQGYTESTSAGPFADYLSQGMGSKPMVIIYEAQFLNEMTSDNSRIQHGDGRTLAYPYPTVCTREMAALGVAENIPANVLGIDPPDHDTLEALIEGVSASCSLLTDPDPSLEEEQ